MTPPQDPPLKSPEGLQADRQAAQTARHARQGQRQGGLRHRRAAGGRKDRHARALPVFGGKVAHVDDARRETVPGVRQVVVLDDLVAVIGDHMWAAKQGLDALDITWDEGPNAEVTTRDVLDGLIAASADSRAPSRKSTATPPRRSAAATRLEASYHVPFLAHAPMEPMNCTVHVRADACEIWVGNQVLDARARRRRRRSPACHSSKVIVHNHLIGGGFGRRLEVDMASKRPCASPRRSTGPSR